MHSVHSDSNQAQALFLSVAGHMGLIALVGGLAFLERNEPRVLRVSLETIAAKKNRMDFPAALRPAVDPISKTLEPKDLENPAGSVSSSKPQGSGVRVQTLKDQFLIALQNHFQNQLLYPSASIAERETGTVEVSFTIDRSGLMSQVSLDKSSPYSRLNRAAVELVESVGHFRAFPEELQEDRLRVVIPIDYRL